jgi:hypothetical protein
MNFALQSMFHTSKVYLTCCKNLRHGADDFTSPPKEGVLRIFIDLKNPSPSLGFEPANLGSNGKQAEHYITEEDKRWYTTRIPHGAATQKVTV